MLLSIDKKTLMQVDSELETFDIPEGVTNFTNYAFHYCKELKSVTIPNSVVEITEYGFSGCENLQEIVIPDSVTEIKYCAFKDCIKLTTITIPNSVTYIDNLAFRNCNNLSNIQSNLTDSQIKEAFGDEEQYNNYCRRNREYKLNNLLYEL